MLNKIIEYERRTMNNRLHHAICIGIATENYGGVKVMLAKIGSKRINLTESFEFNKDNYTYYPDLISDVPVKKIYENIYNQIINGFDDEGVSLSYLIGPTKSPGQIFKLFDYRNTKNPHDSLSIESHMPTQIENLSPETVQNKKKEYDNFMKNIMKGSKQKEKLSHRKSKSKKHNINSNRESKGEDSHVVTFENNEENKDENTYDVMVNHGNKDVSPYSVDYENPLAHEGKLNAIFEGDEHNKVIQKNQINYNSNEVENIQHNTLSGDEESN